MQLPSRTNSARPQIISKLEKMLTKVDQTPLTKWQKLLMYTAGVSSPHLTSPDPGIPTFIGGGRARLSCHSLHQVVSRPKKLSQHQHPLPPPLTGWSEPCSALNCLQETSGLSRQIQLLTSRDGCVRFLTDQSLKHEQCTSWVKFQPAIQANVMRF